MVRASRRLLFAGTSLLVAVSACDREYGSRDVTPWLRVEAWRPSDALLAESGQNHDRYRIEVREGGGWRTITDEASGGCAFPLAGGAGAVVGDDLFAPDGRVTHLVCHGSLLPSRDGSGATCIEQQPGPAIAMATYDREGRRLERRDVALPERVPPSPHAVGHRGADWIFATQVGSACGVYALHESGAWEELRPLEDCAAARRAATAIVDGPVPRDPVGASCVP